MSAEFPRPAVDSLLHTLQAKDSPRPLLAAQSGSTGPHTSDGAGPEARHVQSRMRSSIACIRCRRSKVKCVNSGVGTPCRSCENSGRDCQYPSPVTTTGAGTKRRDSLGGKADGHGDGGERRQRPRKNPQNGTSNLKNGASEGLRATQDALDPTLLTPTVWQELFDCFQVHYAADLPFLHPPTFLKPLRQAAKQVLPPETAPNHVSSSPRPAVSETFLLAFLALTARFHPKLVAHHSPPTASRPSNPLIASEYYAAAASGRLGYQWGQNEFQVLDIERVQALLMVGLHEWGMCRGAKAWLTIGSAIRQAQAMGLQYEMDLDDEPLSRSVALSGEAERMGIDSRKNSFEESRDASDVFIQQEIRRRTFWSCFIMDRYLSSGKYRPQMLHAKELRIQLPASERSFLFAEKVRTLMLGEEERQVAGRAEVESHRHSSVLLGAKETPERRLPPIQSNLAMHQRDGDLPRLETGADEGLVSRYIKILEIYGKVVKWSCAGGRRRSEYPPWDPRCEFYQLRKECLEFKHSLPRQHSLTPQNTQAHNSLKTSTPYTLIHAVYSLCQIALNREYVPFIPIRCAKPEGPLDAPLFPPERYDVPSGFWENSAAECFQAARELIDLVRSCQEWSALVETPIIGFAIYTAAFTGVYCINFPQMDPNGYLCTPKDHKQEVDRPPVRESHGFEASRKALEMLGQMQSRLHMADGWFKTINQMHKYYRRMKKDYKRNIAALETTTSESDSPASTRHLSLREGGIGGGLDEFKVIERTLKDFGKLEDNDVEMTDAGRRPFARGLDAYDDSGSGTTVKSEDGDRPPAPTTEPKGVSGGHWNAINTGSGAAASNGNTALPTPASNGQFRAYDTYPHASQHAHAPTPTQQPNYSHQINSFRPAYHDNNSAAPPSLTSPNSHSVTTGGSNPSPPFDRGQNPQFAVWQQTTDQRYSLHPPQQNTAYQNGMLQQQPPQIISGPPGYPHPAPLHQIMQAPSGMPVTEPHQPWNTMQKEAWLDSLNTRFGGDDIAAFIDGGELADWAAMAARGGYDPGWLTTIWQPGNMG